MDKILKFLIILCLEIISVIIILILGICYLFGGLNLEIFEFGFIFYIMIIFFIVLIIAIPFFVIKYKFKYIFIAYLLTVFVFCLGVRSSIEHINGKYASFSYDLWTNYDVVRQVMYKDLENDKEFFSYSRDKVIEKLGEPNLKYTDEFCYKTAPGYIVVEFGNDKVEKIYWDFP